MFQSPLGTLWLISIPMGYTNSMQIQHRDLTFLLQDKIPDIAVPFVDDVPVKDPLTHYKTGPDSFETLCYESPKKEKVSHTFRHLIANIKSYNEDKI